MRLLAMIFRLWKVAYWLYPQMLLGSKLLDQEAVCRVAGCGAGRKAVEREPKAESPGWQ